MSCVHHFFWHYLLIPYHELQWQFSILFHPPLSCFTTQFQVILSFYDYLYNINFLLFSHYVADLTDFLWFPPINYEKVPELHHLSCLPQTFVIYSISNFPSLRHYVFFSKYCHHTFNLHPAVKWNQFSPMVFYCRFSHYFRVCLSLFFSSMLMSFHGKHSLNSKEL